MSKHLLAALGVVMFLSACATVRDSRINPLNWFGRDRSEVATIEGTDIPIDQRRLVTQVISLNVDPFPGGAIIRAIGLPPTQGFWDAELVEVEHEDPGTVVYEFRLLPPVAPRRQGTQRSREIIAGATLSTIRLEGVRSIAVVGAQNRRSVRR